MDRTACTEPQCMYKGALYLYFTASQEVSHILWKHKVHSGVYKPDRPGNVLIYRLIDVDRASHLT